VGEGLLLSSRGMGGREVGEGTRNGWIGALQKLTTVLGRFDTYKGGSPGNCVWFS
jgi:hypothetical protein